jgi:hypothetical protein
MLEIRTLTDGGQTASEVMAWITEFVNVAERSLDFAHYDLHLGSAGCKTEQLQDHGNSGPFSPITIYMGAPSAPAGIPR